MCALVVVNALKASPWGTFTIAVTMPIAVLMGVVPAALCGREKCWKAPSVGFVLVLARNRGDGQWVANSIGRAVVHADRADAWHS